MLTVLLICCFLPLLIVVHVQTDGQGSEILGFKVSWVDVATGKRFFKSLRREQVLKVESGANDKTKLEASWCLQSLKPLEHYEISVEATNAKGSSGSKPRTIMTPGPCGKWNKRHASGAQ